MTKTSARLQGHVALLPLRSPSWAYFLAAAILFTLTIRRVVVRSQNAEATSRAGKIVALVSILLWSGVGIMGRGIGFY